MFYKSSQFYRLCSPLTDLILTYQDTLKKSTTKSHYLKKKLKIDYKIPNISFVKFNEKTIQIDLVFLQIKT